MTPCLKNKSILICLLEIMWFISEENGSLIKSEYDVFFLRKTVSKPAEMFWLFPPSVISGRPKRNRKRIWSKNTKWGKYFTRLWDSQSEYQIESWHGYFSNVYTAKISTSVGVRWNFLQWQAVCWVALSSHLIRGCCGVKHPWWCALLNAQHWHK